MSYDLREQDMVNSHQLGDHIPFRIRLLSSPLVLRRATAPLPPDEPAPGTAAGSGETGSVARRKLHKNPHLRGRFQHRDRPPPPEVARPLLQPLRGSGGKADRRAAFPPDHRVRPGRDPVRTAVASEPMPYEVHTPVFEGDLELLTQLVSRQELDVFGLCLASLVEAFLAEAKAAVASGAEPYDLDTSTEFLLLAATLVELKTRYLLIEDDDEVPDELPTPEDRDLLLARLLQGRTFKEAAKILNALIQAADRCAPRRMGPEEPLASVDIDPLESVDGRRAAARRCSGRWPPARSSTCTT